MIAPEMGGHRFAFGGIALEQTNDFYATTVEKKSKSAQEVGRFHEFVVEGMTQEQGVAHVGGTAKEVAALPTPQLYRGNFDSSQVLGADAPMDRSTSCHVPSKPLDASFLEQLTQLFESIFSDSAADEKCPDPPQVAQQAPEGSVALASQGVGVAKPAMPTAKTPYDDIIHRASATHDVGEDVIRAVINVESRFNPAAKSREGAMGLMQLMPRTAKELGVRKPFNPEDNIMGGALYLSRLLDRYNGDIKLALTAYNWGPGNLENHPRQVPKVIQKYVANIMAQLDNPEVAARG